MFRGEQACRAAALQWAVQFIGSVTWAAVLLLSPQSQAMTKYSRQILELQNTFAQASSLHPIVYLDRDLLKPVMTQPAPDDPTVQSRHVRMMQDFILARSQVSVDEVSADILADFLRAGANVALPMTLSDKKTKICAIVPADPNLNSRQEAERLLSWSALKETLEYSQREIASLMTKDDFMLLSNIHETFHCLDQVYLAKREQSGIVDDLLFHKSESFAEVGALLYIASYLGRRNLASVRARYRTVGSFMSGRYGHLLGPQLDNLSWGAIYTLTRAIEATIPLTHEIAEQVPLQKIVERAYAIVEQHALTELEIFTIDRYQKDPDGQMELIKKFTIEEGALSDRFRSVQMAREAYEQTLAKDFDQLLVTGSSPRIEATLETSLINRISQYRCDQTEPPEAYESQIDEIRALHYAHDMAQPSVVYKKLMELTSCR